MKAGISRTLGRVAVGIGAAACAVVGVTSGPAAADSPYIDSRSGDCAAAWRSGSNEFWVVDWEVDDGEGCAVLYSFKADHKPSTWIWNPAHDEGGIYPTDPNGDEWVFFKVCDHRDRNASNCTDWKRYGT